MSTNMIRVMLTLAAVAVAVASSSAAQTFSTSQTSQGANGLAGTSWKLVKLQDGDQTTSVPDDGSKYTITFGTDAG